MEYRAGKDGKGCNVKELRELRRGVIYRAGSNEKGCEVSERGDRDGEASVLQSPRHPVSWVTRLQVIQALYCT